MTTKITRPKVVSRIAPLLLILTIAIADRAQALIGGSVAVGSAPTMSHAGGPVIIPPYSGKPLNTLQRFP